MSIQIIQNTVGYVNPSVSILDTGWSISDIYATHTSCNAGIIKSMTSLGLIVGHTYTVTYTVDNYVSGGVNVIAGTTNGTSRTANGTYTENITVASIPQLSFYSDGSLRISILSFYDVAQGITSGTTVCFNEKYNKWTSEYSAIPELWIKFVDNFFSVKNGQLWLHNSNEIRNNFYNVQYTSKITFYVNINPEMVKNFYSIRQQSTSAWSSSNDGDIFINPYQGKPNGQMSRLKGGNYRNLQGDWFADFLRDLSDPRFGTTLDALFNGADLQGKVMEITIENADITEVRLVHIDAKTAPQNYTY